MAISYTLPNGRVVTALADLADEVFVKRQGLAAVPTNGELIVVADRKPGTAVS